MFGQNAPLMFPIFLKESLVFPLFFFFLLLSIVHWRRPSCLLDILQNFMFNWMYLSLSRLLFASLHSSAICKASSDSHFALLLFFFFGIILFTASSTVLWTSVHSSSVTLLIRSSPLNLSVTSTMNSYQIWFKSYQAGLIFKLHNMYCIIVTRIPLFIMGKGGMELIPIGRH